MTARTALAGTPRPARPTPAGVRLRRVRPQTRPSRAKVLSLQIAVVVVIVGGWQLAGSEHWISTLFWSTPALIWDRAVQLFNGEQVDGGNIYGALGYTVAASLIGFLIGTVAGALIGLSLWWSRTAERVMSPFVIVFHALPKFALAPLLLLIIGLGMKSEIALAVALTIVTSLFTAQSGVRAVDPDQVRLCESLGGSRLQTFTKIVVPTTLPWIISALRINIGLALAGAIIGEMVASNNGVGHMITYAASVYDVALIWVGTALLAIVAVIMYAGVSLLERRLLIGLHARSS
jgi:NitT/TauT family transport system permease protein